MDAELKSVLDSIRESTGSYGEQIKAIQSQVDAIDRKMVDRHASGGSGGEDLLKKAFEESAEFQRLMELGKGSAVIKVKDLPAIERKTTITSDTLGYGTAGVIMPQGVGEIVRLPERRLFLRDLLFRGGRIESGAAFFIRENTFTNNASPQVSEGYLKGESANTFTTTTRNVATIAHWIPVSRQALADMPALAEHIRRKLLFGLRFKEELLFLAGDGTGDQIEGLLTAGTAFDTGLLGASYTKADVLRRALQQVEEADETPTGFFVLNPADWADMELSKNSNGDYLIGNPRAATAPTLWGRPAIITNGMAAGTFLAGSSEAAEVFDRLDATIEVSLDYSDYRARNLAMILCENRTVLCIYRPGAFIYGNLNSSP